MDIDAYIDSIVELVRGAGVTDQEIYDAGVRMMLEHAFMKGVDWTEAARATCRVLKVDIEELGKQILG